MTVTYEQSIKDVFDWIEHQRNKRKQEFPLRAIVTLVIIAYGFLQRGHNMIAWVLFAVAVSLAAGPLLAPWQQASWRRRMELIDKVSTSEKIPESLRTQKTLTLELGGLRVTESHAQREVLHYWESLQGVTELERIIAVELGKKLQPAELEVKVSIPLPSETLLIPKRAFATPDDCAAFVAELRGKLPVGEAKETPSGES